MHSSQLSYTAFITDRIVKAYVTVSSRTKKLFEQLNQLRLQSPGTILSVMVHLAGSKRNPAVLTIGKFIISQREKSRGSDSVVCTVMEKPGSFNPVVPYPEAGSHRAAAAPGVTAPSPRNTSSVLTRHALPLDHCSELSHIPIPEANISEGMIVCFCLPALPLGWGGISSHKTYEEERDAEIHKASDRMDGKRKDLV